MNLKYKLPIHRHFLRNKNGRDFFVGDIHGQHSIFFAGLHELNFNFMNDRIFSVGDTTDRGEHSYQCLHLAEESWFYPVLGNHESFILDYDKSDYIQKKLWYRNGGGWWEQLSVDERQEAKNIILNNYHFSISVETKVGLVGVIHAQYPSKDWPLNEVELDENQINKLIWGRADILENKIHKVNHVNYIVSGHTPLLTPVLISNKLFIDTGCGHIASNRMAKPRLTLCEFKNDAICMHSMDEDTFESYRFNL